MEFDEPDVDPVDNPDDAAYFDTACEFDLAAVNPTTTDNSINTTKAPGKASTTGATGAATATPTAAAMQTTSATATATATVTAAATATAKAITTATSPTKAVSKKDLPIMEGKSESLAVGTKAGLAHGTSVGVVSAPKPEDASIRNLLREEEKYLVHVVRTLKSASIAAKISKSKVEVAEKNYTTAQSLLPERDHAILRVGVARKVKRLELD